MTGCTFHQNDVLAIVNRLIEYPLFSTPLDKQSIDSFGVRCIDSMSNVECFRDPDFKSAEIAFPMNWTDILGDSDNEYFAKSSLLSVASKIELSERIGEYLNQCFGASFRLSQIAIGASYAEEVQAMVESLLAQRALCGILNGHFKEVYFSILKGGGFPCGWTGGPDGQLVVFLPFSR